MVVGELLELYNQIIQIHAHFVRMLDGLQYLVVQAYSSTVPEHASLISHVEQRHGVSVGRLAGNTDGTACLIAKGFGLNVATAARHGSVCGKGGVVKQHPAQRGPRIGNASTG